MAACHSNKIKSRAARQDEGAIVILVLVMLAIFSSLTLIFGLLTQAKAASDGGKFLYIGLAALAILIAWLVMQAVFTMHYAHKCYAPENIEADAPRVLEFPKDTLRTIGISSMSRPRSGRRRKRRTWRARQRNCAGS